MRFEKVIINGEEYYRKVEDTADSAADTATDDKTDGDCTEYDIPLGDERRDEVNDAEEDTERGAEDKEKTKFRKDAEQFFERMSAGARDFSDRFDKGAKEFGDKFAKGAKDFGDKFAKGMNDLKDKIVGGAERLFGSDRSRDPESLDARLLKILPYMSGEELKDVAERILKDDEAFSELDLGFVMPFLPSDVCDAFFLKGLELEKDSGELLAAVPFVSDECMDKVTDSYIEGEYPKLEIDIFYPFMSDENIKKIFYYIVGDKKE